MVKGPFSVCGFFFPFLLGLQYRCVWVMPNTDKVLLRHSVTLCAWQGLHLQGHKYLFHMDSKCPGKPEH